MAEDNKRNALFSKLFSKEKKQEAPNTAEDTLRLDEIMSDEATPSQELANDTPSSDENGEYEAWLAEAMTEGEEASDEELSDTLAELFGAGDTAEEDTQESLDIPMLEDYDTAPCEDGELSPSGDAELDGELYAAEDEWSEEASICDDMLDSDVGEVDETDVPDTPEEGMDGSETATELDEDTATLLAALGYSRDNANELGKHEQAAKHKSNRTTDLSLAYGYEGREYTSHAQTTSIKSAYARDRFKLLIRLGGTVIFALLLFIYDTFGKSFGGVLDAEVYPVVNILISLQLLMITAAFSVKQLFYGINSIFKAEPIVHSLSAAAVAITMLYDIVLAIVAPAAFTLYNFPAAICLLFGAAHDLFVLEREIYVFDRLSSWQSVATLERLDTSALAAELGEFRSDEADNKIGRAFRMRRGDFAENYFRHINRRNPMAKSLNFIIAPVVALSLVVFIISLASDKTAIEAFNALLAVDLFSLPTFMLIAMSYPFFTLVAKNLNADAVIFSESDVAEYQSVDTVVFEEADLFDDTSLTINRISVCDKNRMQDVFDIMCGVSALYDRIGGRIAGAFRASTAEGDAPKDISVLHVEDGGFEGMADGRRYTVGSDAYLTSKGIAVMRYYDDKYIASNPGGVVLHIAVDGVEVFKLYLTYRISDSMLSVINELSLSDTGIVMRTIDPNINLELISRILTSTFDGRLTLVRKPYKDTADASECASGALEGGVLVNGENPESILDVVKACKLFSGYSRLNVYVSIALLAVGVLLSIFLGIIGALAGMSSLYIVLFQLLSIIPSFILANLLLK